MGVGERRRRGRSGRARRGRRGCGGTPQWTESQLLAAESGFRAQTVTARHRQTSQRHVEEMIIDTSSGLVFEERAVAGI